MLGRWGYFGIRIWEYWSSIGIPYGHDYHLEVSMLHSLQDTQVNFQSLRLIPRSAMSPYIYLI